MKDGVFIAQPVSFSEPIDQTPRGDDCPVVQGMEVSILFKSRRESVTQGGKKQLRWCKEEPRWGFVVANS